MMTQFAFHNELSMDRGRRVSGARLEIDAESRVDMWGDYYLPGAL